MKRYITLAATFMIMVFLGGVYGWSVIAAELIENYGFSGTQSQLIFSCLVAVYPITMIFAGIMERKITHRRLTQFSGILFLFGYLIAGFSGGNFAMVFMGVGVFAGIGTGLGYWVSLNSTVRWFPNKKGLITGIVTAGFGGGAIVMSQISKILLSRGFNVLELILVFGIVYGISILLLSGMIFQNRTADEHMHKKVNRSDFIRSKTFANLLLGFFFGTFAGLMIIGSLKIIGTELKISERLVILSISLYAITNFIGRIIWGYICDIINVKLAIFALLLLQTMGIILLNIPGISSTLYLTVVLLIGFTYGGNFVLFAKETAQSFGIINFGIIYPYVFIGKAFAGILGPLSGGVLFDFFSSYYYAIILAGAISFSGSMLYLHIFLKERKMFRLSGA
jgi:MFS transporter, OFA family, oxalate/formate antiporter